MESGACKAKKQGVVGTLSEKRRWEERWSIGSSDSSKELFTEVEEMDECVVNWKSDNNDEVKVKVKVKVEGGGPELD